MTSTPRSSMSIVEEQERRMDAEIDQLLVDIRRIGPTHPPPSPKVLFGELFDDDDVQQHYEALVGTLKCAKKRGFINYRGQMLLKGMHDKVLITIVGENTNENGAQLVEEEQLQRTPPPVKAKALKNSSRMNIKAKPKSPIKEKRKSEIAGTFSDSEAPFSQGEVQGSEKTLTLTLTIASDSEADHSVLRSPRRLVVPTIFKPSSSQSSNTPSVEGRPPPAPWRMKKTASVPHLRKPLVLKRWSEQFSVLQKERSEVSSKAAVKETSVAKATVTPAASKERPQSFSTCKRPTLRTPAPQLSKSVGHISTKPISTPMKSPPVRNLSGEVASQVQDEVHQLLVDIRRVGSNPGEPSVKFGELFDDEEVQNTYEALVGTLRSAKRQGLISFKGQMLLKGMHDNVVITVMESS